MEFETTTTFSASEIWEALKQYLESNYAKDADDLVEMTFNNEEIVVKFIERY